jgi:hypothetical protein
MTENVKGASCFYFLEILTVVQPSFGARTFFAMHSGAWSHISGLRALSAGVSHYLGVSKCLQMSPEEWDHA